MAYRVLYNLAKFWSLALPQRAIFPIISTASQNGQTELKPLASLPLRKAWTEMIHRYAAGTLGLLILFIGLNVLLSRFKKYDIPWRLPAVLIILVLFQAALGMWTVTLNLLPIVVMGHLLGGVLLFACLLRFRMQLCISQDLALASWRTGLRVGALIVLFQIALGGWVSANYAGISCIGFPLCNGVWVPKLHLLEGFNLFSPIGNNYQGGVLKGEVRASIQFIHRIGALVTASYIMTLSALMILKVPSKRIKTAAWIMILLVSLQFILGVLNVIYLLPINIALAHNVIAAVLFALIFTLLLWSQKGKIYAL